MIEREIEDRFAYHTTTEKQRDTMAEIRNQCRATADYIHFNVPEPEASKAIDALELAMFHANAGVARQ